MPMAGHISMPVYMLEGTGPIGHENMEMDVEIQSRPGDAQIKLHVEGIVVGREGARHGAAGNHVHHRCLDFEKFALDEEAADVVDDARALAKNLPFESARVSMCLGILTGLRSRTVTGRHLGVRLQRGQ